MIERDNHSGYKTTGHEWNGIKELNTPVPRLVILFLIGTFLFSVVYWFLMPSFPLVDRYLPGKLGVNERVALAEKITQADVQKKSSWTDRLETTDFDDIVYDDDLMAKVNFSGARLFEDNCSMCHGRDGVGNLNYPSLADQAWLWGDDPDHIMETLRVGINSEHPQTRVAIMPGFGAIGALDENAIENVVAYVRNEARLTVPVELMAPDRQQAGKKTYQTICAACHGQDLQGNQAMGAPNLVDRYWIYGSDTAQVISGVHNGRQGHMPSWESRLDTYQRKILALYVTTLD